MKRILSFFAAVALTAGLSLAGNTPVQAQTVNTPPKVSVSLLITKPRTVKLTAAQALANASHKLPPVNASGIHPNTLCTSNCFDYAGGQTNPTPVPTGVYSGIDLEVPTRDGDSHTLAELAVESTNGQQAVEVGWNVDHAVNGDEHPHLFIYSWVNGVPKGYNLSNPGFVQCTVALCGAGTYYTVGMDLNSAVTTPATEKKFGIEHFGGAWWFAYDAGWIGYIADSQWTGASPSVIFNTAPFFQLFGEVAKVNTVPCAKMGDGNKGTGTVGARVAITGYNSGATAVQQITTLFQTNPTYYTVAMATAGGLTSTKTARYGGDNTSC
jgi:hypothetical protein